MMKFVATVDSSDGQQKFDHQVRKMHRRHKISFVKSCQANKHTGASMTESIIQEAILPKICILHTITPSPTTPSVKATSGSRHRVNKVPVLDDSV